MVGLSGSKNSLLLLSAEQSVCLNQTVVVLILVVAVTVTAAAVYNMPKSSGGCTVPEGVSWKKK